MWRRWTPTVAAVLVPLIAGGCTNASVAHHAQAAATMTTHACPSSHAAGWPCTRPKVTVAPAGGLRNHQRVIVWVTGFAEGKVFLSECAASADVNAAGCGQQLAAQPFLVTGDNRTASGTFWVSDYASARPYDLAATRKCADRCVIVATLGLGLGGDYAYAPISFARK
jgi:hypothetical protein